MYKRLRISTADSRPVRSISDVRSVSQQVYLLDNALSETVTNKSYAWSCLPHNVRTLCLGYVLDFLCMYTIDPKGVSLEASVAPHDHTRCALIRVKQEAIRLLAFSKETPNS